MKRSTMIKASYEIRRVLKELGDYFGIHRGEYAPNTQKYELYDKIEKHIDDGLKIFSQDVTDEEDKDTLLRRIHGETPVARLKSYLGQQKALLNDFIETRQPEGQDLLMARVHIATYDDCLKAVTNILEEVPA
jgi:hypothetical protein